MNESKGLCVACSAMAGYGFASHAKQLPEFLWVYFYLRLHWSNGNIARINGQTHNEIRRERKTHKRRFKSRREWETANAAVRKWSRPEFVWIKETVLHPVCGSYFEHNYCAINTTVERYGVLANQRLAVITQLLSKVFFFMIMIISNRLSISTIQRTVFLLSDRWTTKIRSWQRHHTKCERQAKTESIKQCIMNCVDYIQTVKWITMFAFCCRYSVRTEDNDNSKFSIWNCIDDLIASEGNKKKRFVKFSWFFFRKSPDDATPFQQCVYAYPSNGWNVLFFLYLQKIMFDLNILCAERANGTNKSLPITPIDIWPVKQYMAWNLAHNERER